MAQNYLNFSNSTYITKSRAFFHHFGNMTHTPGIGKFHVILPEIGKFSASLGNTTFKSYLLFFGHCHIYLILSIISGLKKQMMQIVLFFHQKFLF
jgi:hypothetical protein